MPTVNPELLKWARKSAKITYEKAAKTISKTCKPDRIKEWETIDGKEQPSLKQTEKLARLYRRPVEVFYLPFVPKDYPALKDFRKNKEEGTDTALIFMMREVQEKQEWMSNFMKNRQKKNDFVGKYNIKSDPQAVARDIRKTLGADPNDKTDKPMRYWIDKAESKNIYVTLSSNYHTRLKLDSDVFKDFVIADKYASFVFINSEDWDHNQLVTLIHSLAHIWIGVSGISVDTEINGTKKDVHPVEKFCNQVTALVLTPQEELKKLLPDPAKLEYKNIKKAARKIGVDTSTIIYRATELGLIQNDKSNEFKKAAAEEWKEFLYKLSQKKKSSGGPNYYIMQLRRSSKAFSNVVMDNYKRGKINGNDASRLLKVKEANFVKFEKYIYK